MTSNYKERKEFNDRNSFKLARSFPQCPTRSYLRYLMFVLHDPSVNQWLKDHRSIEKQATPEWSKHIETSRRASVWEDGGRDFAFELPDEVCKAPEPAAKASLKGFDCGWSSGNVHGLFILQFFASICFCIRFYQYNNWLCIRRYISDLKIII